MLSIPIKRVLVFALIMGLAFSFSAVTFAQDEVGTTTEEVQESTTTEDEVEEKMDVPGVLPTNPFYFFKELTRGVRRFFTFDPEKRANFELDVIREKGEELRAVERMNPDNLDAINSAIDNYNENVDRLRNNLEGLSDNPNVERLLERLDERTDRHNELFDGLLERHEDLRDRISDARHRFEEARKFADELRHRRDVDDGDDDNGDDDVDDDEDVDKDENDDDEDDSDENRNRIDRSGRRDGSFGPIRVPGDGVLSCIELYNPVCGKNGRTYANECFAEVAGADIEHRGRCDENISDRNGDDDRSDDQKEDNDRDDDDDTDDNGSDDNSHGDDSNKIDAL